MRWAYVVVFQLRHHTRESLKIQQHTGTTRKHVHKTQDEIDVEKDDKEKEEQEEEDQF